MTISDYAKQIDEVIAAGPLDATWESLGGRTTPKWYYGGKFGIFIHWGIYSVPAYGCEWYSRYMYDHRRKEYRHHLEHYGSPARFGYKDFIPLFKGEHFDAQRWVKLFRQAGARFIMPVAEHHDGFAMYDTEFNRWKAPAMGICRDYLGELKAACQQENLVMCASTHRAEHYFFMNLGREIDSDVNDPRFADFYGPAVLRPDLGSQTMSPTTENPETPGPTDEWMTDWMVRTCELVDRYQPGSLYFDWWIHNHAFQPYLKKIAAYYYTRAAQWGREVTINFKHDAMPRDAGTFDVERGALTGISPIPWQTDTAIGRESWGYVTNNDFKPARQLIGDLIDVVSKNGMLLLNIGPKPDGTFTEEETAVLEQIGAWLSVNGEGIYDTTPWERFGEGEVNCTEGFFQDGDEKPFTAKDFRFTRKEQTLYAFWMHPEGEKAIIKSLSGRKVRSVNLLGTGAVAFENAADGLLIAVPQMKDEKPVCFKIEF